MPRFSHSLTLVIAGAVFLIFSRATAIQAALHVGMAETDITPRVDAESRVWIAGYGQGRKATAVHDPLLARAVVFSDGQRKVAMVCADVVGVMRPTVQRIRAKLAGFDYVMISATHNHEGPDTIGLWGPTPIESGIDADYMTLFVDQCVAAIDAADRAKIRVDAHYGTAEDETLLGDSRLPKVKDGVLRVLRFTRAGTDQTAGILLQWNCHPEALGPRNTLITADFPWATVAALTKKHDCPIAYFTGPVGGLMAPPDGVIKDEKGVELKEGDFKYAEAYGRRVADLTNKAIDAARPITLTPIRTSAKRVYLPLANPLYRAARKFGVLQREAFTWTGDPFRKGDAFDDDKPGEPAVETEVACLRLGELSVACIPGEIYPELVYGNVQDPADAGADYPDAPVEKHLTAMLPSDKCLIIGLANDEIGYIIPKRQWDILRPYAYGRTKAQYGEVNSVGPEVAPILMKALDDVMKE